MINMENYSYDNNSERESITLEENALVKTFLWMFLGLLSTAIVASYTYFSGLWVPLLLKGYWGILLIAELVVVILFNFLFKKLSPTAVGVLYFIYAAINGVSFCSIFVLFELESIILLFVGSALLFGGLAFYGYKTHKDLSNWITLLFPTLIAILIVSLVNIFLGNPMLDLVVDAIVLLTFFGVTIYDMNKVKQLSLDEGIDKSKLHIYGAMQLYLDFINIFIRILSLFGKRRD